MKSHQDLRRLSLIFLSATVLMGISLPAFGVLSLSKTVSTEETTTEVLTAKKWSFPNFRRQRASHRRRPGARAGGSCLARKRNFFTPLLPPDQTSKLRDRKTYHKSIWNTVSDKPTVFFNIPEFPKQFTGQAELMLINEKGDTIYFARLKLPEQPGIVSVTFPENKEKAQWIQMQAGEEYRWKLMVICDNEDATRNPQTGGWIQTVKVDSTLAEKLATTDQSEYPLVYAESEIVYELISTLGNLRQANPNDLEIKEKWHKLLRAMDREEMIDFPLVGSATILEESNSYILPEF